MHRDAPRIKKRLPCNIRITGRQHGGMILNVSPRGLFVQTNAAAEPGDTIDMDLRVPAFSDPIPVQARVVWKRRVPQHLRNVAEGGFGVRIENAGENFYRYLDGLLATG